MGREGGNMAKQWILSALRIVVFVHRGVGVLQTGVRSVEVQNTGSTSRFAWGGFCFFIRE